MAQEMTKVESVDNLFEILNERKWESAEFFIQTVCGRSWKTISLTENENEIWVLNQIDDTEENYTMDELKTNEHPIGRAIQNGAFYFAWR